MSTGWPPFRYHFSTTLESSTIFFSNMIIKEKNGSTFQSGTVVQNGSRVEPFWLHFFSQCTQTTIDGWTKGCYQAHYHFARAMQSIRNLLTFQNDGESNKKFECNFFSCREYWALIKRVLIDQGPWSFLVLFDHFPKTCKSWLRGGGLSYRPMVPTLVICCLCCSFSI